MKLTGASRAERGSEGGAGRQAGRLGLYYSMGPGEQSSPSRIWRRRAHTWKDTNALSQNQLNVTSHTMNKSPRSGSKGPALWLGSCPTGSEGQSLIECVAQTGASHAHPTQGGISAHFSFFHDRAVANGIDWWENAASRVNISCAGGMSKRERRRLWHRRKSARDASDMSEGPLVIPTDAGEQ